MPKKKISKKHGFCFDDMPALGLNKKTKVTKHHPEEFFKNLNKVKLRTRLQHR